jgi:SAM-dependent methyltransferase
MTIVHYTECPSCSDQRIAPVFEATDFTVSKQSFSIWSCTSCRLLFTQDVPDQESIGPFYQSAAYVSHSDTRQGLINRLYHQVRERTLLAKYRLVVKETGTDKRSLLDIGCGTGAFLRTMRSKGWTVRGLEPDRDTRERTKTQYQLTIDAPDQLYHLPDQSVEAITMWHVLEHVHALHDYFDNIKRILKPGGKLFIAVPNHTSLDAAFYRTYWAAYDVPRHLYHFSPESMTRLAAIHGFNLRAIYPMWYDAFYVSMLSEQYRNGKTSLWGYAKALFNGAASNINALFQKQQCSSLIYVLDAKPV